MGQRGNTQNGGNGTNTENSQAKQQAGNAAWQQGNNNEWQGQSVNNSSWQGQTAGNNNWQANQKEEAREAINRIKQQAKNGEQWNQKQFNNYNRNNNQNKIISIGIIVAIIVIVVFLGGKIFGKNSFYGTYELVEIEGLYNDYEKDIEDIKYSLIFKRNKTGNVIIEERGSKIEVDFTWEKERNYITIIEAAGTDQEYTYGGKDDSTVIKWEKGKIIVEDDIADERGVFKKK